MMDFSIIIPAFNTEKYIKDCLDSIFKNDYENIDFEVLVVDDCSTDSTFDVLTNMKKEYENLIVLQTETNCGPGGARNLGIENATGDWILFLDSDDQYALDALNNLKKFIDTNDDGTLDVVGFNWAYHPNSSSIPKTHFEGRIDNHYFELDKEQLVRKYLQLQMDNSVIYSGIRRKLIIDNDIKFSQGYHEDVDYIFTVYWYSSKIRYFSKVIYYKTSRIESIVNTISVNHIKGFIRAYENIGSFLKQKREYKSYYNDYNIGLIALIATRVREIYRNSNENDERAELYNELYDMWQGFKYSIGNENFPYNRTLYSKICEYFLKVMNAKDKSIIEKELLIGNYLDEVSSKRWSCQDLHYSVFLRPDEIRTCCKRFFVNDEMRGDVALVNLNEYDSSTLNANLILEKKKELYLRINKGEETECSDCPFLEFKKWGSLEIRNLSFEYHSICNLRCTYCSENYYGAVEPKYDVGKLVDDFISKKMLTSDASIIWAGGEPVLGKNFESLLKTVTNLLPNTRHRILTNSVIYSEIVSELLSKNKVSIYTSIDAGTRESFINVRGSDKLHQVMKNLKKYALENSKKITIKYIFTEGNQTLEEVYAFANIISEYGLEGCSYQISYDFNKKQISMDVLVLMVMMYKLLKDLDCQVVYFDELIWQRRYKFNYESEVLLKATLKEINAYEIIANHDSYKSVVIWGAGEMAKLLVEKSVFFNHVNVDYFVDSTPEKVGTKYLGYEVKSPDALLSSDTSVIIAAVQNYPNIYQLFLKLNINDARLIDKLII